MERMLFRTDEDAVEVSCYDEAVKGFGASLYVSMSEKKVYFEGWQYAKLMEVPLTFTLCEFVKTTASFGRNPIRLYKFVLMDGSHSIFKAAVNSGLSSLLKGQTLRRGTSITVTKYHWIWQRVPEDSDDDELDGKLGNGVMVIDGFTWREGPFKGDKEPTPDDVSRTSVDYVVNFIDPSVLDYCMKKNALMYLSEHWSQDCAMILSTMLWDEIKRGLFIPDKQARGEWVTAMKKRAREEKRVPGSAKPKECDCQTRFCLDRCVKVSYSLDNFDTADLYDSVKVRLGGKVDADTWDGLHPQKKRWCFYWWYAVNIYHCSTAQELPVCLVDYVRETYPNPDGESFVGHKSAEKRATEAHERALKAMVGNTIDHNKKKK